MQENFVFFEKSTEVIYEIKSSNFYHYLVMPHDKVHFIDPFGSEVATIPSGCSAFVYPLTSYQLSTTTDNQPLTDLLAINCQIIENHIFSTNFFSKITEMLRKSDYSLIILDKEITNRLKLVYEKISNEFQLEWMISTLEILKIISSANNPKIIASPTDIKKHRLFFNQVNNYIANNIFKTIDIKNIASDLCLSESVFSHRFRKIFNTSFHHYFLIKKIEKSCEILKYSSDNVQEIGFNLGFSSTSHFISTFKKIKNITPCKYRRQQQQSNNHKAT
ncbi:MAG: helix-turn-helix transcriptional regulator [Gammaproteobacteria bacterium]|nr:helix-turn-helix transcriptional regulator [Gammaproteobacteria bacterium]